MLDPDKIRAFGPFVLVRRKPVETHTRDGLELPAEQMSKNLHCEVLSVGKGEDVNGTWVSSGLKPGDIVLVRTYDGRRLNVDKTVRLVHHEVVESKAVPIPWPTKLGV